MSFDAVILAGGRAARLGGTPKPGVVIGEATLLTRALEAAAGAERIAVVGPEELRGELDRSGTGERAVLAREEPPFGGPVAGVAAGLDGLARVVTGGVASWADASGGGVEGTSMAGAPGGAGKVIGLPGVVVPGDGGAVSAPWILVLAVDVPRAAAAVPRLVAAVARSAAHPEGLDGGYLLRDGHPQWLVGMYRREALARAVDRLDAVQGASMRRLVASLRCRGVDDPDGLSDDVDTWADVRRARDDAAVEGARETSSRGALKTSHKE